MTGARVVLAGVAAMVASGCLGRAAPHRRGGAHDARITLYRDGALIEERLEVTLDRDGRGSVALTTAAVEPGSLELDGQGATITSWSLRGAGAAEEVIAHIGDRTVVGRRLGVDPDGQIALATDDGIVVTDQARIEQPTQRLELASAARDRTVAVAVRYRTTALTWQASYTLIDDGERRGRLQGALRLDNRTGRQWRRAEVALLDEPMPVGQWSTLAPARRRLWLGRGIAIGPDAQRLDLGLTRRAIPLAPILVYDPVGPRLDGGGMRPNDDPRYGVERWSPQVEVSLSLELAQVSDAPLPAGPIRMFEVAAAGQLAWRGEGQLLPPADGAVRTVAIAIGRSTDVTGRRTQSMFEIDHARERLIEEYKLEFDNRGALPAPMEAREHMYRGKCWSLVYFSTPEVGKEGDQLVSLRTTVPAHGRATIVYRVAYKWSTAQCKK